MKISPYLSDRREIYETDVKYVETCNLQKVWYSSDSPEWKYLLTIFNLCSIYNSNDKRRFFHVGMRSPWEKGREKRTILSYFILLDRSLS